MTNVTTLKAANARRWAAAKLTRSSEFTPVAKRLVANKARFQAMETRTGVPWFVIAVIKERESGADPSWLKSIAQGQAWNKRSTLVPIGRGPFKSWEDAAYDALVNCGPFAARNKDWSPGGALTLLEQYNGLGYAARGMPSPYVWSGTDQYKSGKYVADHVFNANVVDKQLGCAGILLAMQAIDPSINLGKVNPVTPIAEPKPAAANPKAAAAGAAGTAVAAGAGAVAAQAGLSAPEIIAIIAGVSLAAGAAFIIGYRIIKGIWPWTGSQSQALSLPSLQPSEKSLELASAQLALSSADLLAKPSPLPSAPSRRQKQSAKPSPRTRTPRKSSKTSKRSAVKKSSPKRKSKSKS